MNSLTRDSAMLAVVCAVGTIFFASARPLPASDPEICARPTSDVGAEAPFLAENVTAMKKMMGDMAVKPTGDVDADFVAMMVLIIRVRSTWRLPCFAMAAIRRSGGWPRRSS